MKPRLPVLVLMILFGVLLVGCGKDATTKPSTPSVGRPDLPPTDSWNFDLSFFSQQVEPMVLGEGGNVADPIPSNYANAVARVAFVDLVAVSALTPPYLAFCSAVHATPVADGDSTYLWTYSWADSTDHNLQIHLRGRVRPDHVEWSLRVTAPDANPPLHDFLWYTGQSSRTSFTGYWIFNNDVEDQPVEAARIDWTCTAPRARVLTYANIDATSPGYGDTLTYTAAGDDGSLTFHDASLGLDSFIDWNVLTGAGSMQVPDYNGGATACWDGQHENIDCAAP